MATSVSTRARSMLALLAGGLTPFAFAPYAFWPLAVAAPTILLLLIRDLAPRLAARLGWLYGLGLFGHGVWWIQVSVHQFGVPYYVFSVGVTAVFIAVMALYPALFAWLVRTLAHGRSTVTLILAPPLWVLVEFLRGWLGTGFPWLSLGYSQIDGPLAGYAPVIGVGGASLLVMIMAAAAAWAVTRRGKAIPVAVIVIVVLLGSGVALKRVEFTTPLGSPLEAGLVQGAVPQVLKWQAAQREEALARYLALSESLWSADVVIWPETAIAAFPQEVPEIIDSLKRRARAHGTDLLVGMPTGKPWNGRYFNSLVGLGAHGGRYDKRHLVPFGEFFPFKDALSGIAALLDIPLSDFSAGSDDVLTLHAAGHAAGISICYEDAFGREVIAALPQAAFLVNVSNDAWFGDTIAPHQHLEIARMRALETGRYLLRGTNTGITAVIDHQGRIRARAPQFTATALRASFEARSGATPYVMTGDGPLVALLSVVVGLIVWRQRGQGDAIR
ncbi:MAG: apolipoprotein N-acyltransferase [Gammaproteobacteria bacterium]